MARWKPGKPGRPPNSARKQLSKAVTVTKTEQNNQDRFVKTATRRVNRAISSIYMIGNMASPNYDWTPDHLKAMKKHLIDAVDTAFSKFDRVKTNERRPFSFGEPRSEHA